MKYILTDSVKHLKIPSVKIEKSFFPEGELCVRIREDLKGKDVVVISNVMSDNILEVLFIVDAAKKMGAKVKLVIPFLSYARQDKLYVRGESVCGAVVCSVLKSLGVPVTVFDIHSLGLRRYLKFRNFSVLPMLADELPDRDWVVVSPDKGGIDRARKIAKKLKAPMVVIDKVRNGDKVKMKLKGELVRESVLIVEDMISTGETLVEAAKILKKNGAKEIYCIATHGIFVDGARSKLLKSGIKRIFVTNSLPVKESEQIKIGIKFEEKWV